MSSAGPDAEVGPRTGATLDDVIPVAHFSERHRRRIAAPPDLVWAALHDVRSRDLLLTRTLMAVRMLPGRLAGRRPPAPAPARSWIDDAPVPVLAAEPPNRIVAAGVMQPWKLGGGQRPPVLDAGALLAFDEPGWVKCAVDFVLEPGADGTVLCTETRVRATDVVTRIRFGLYWLIIRPGSGLIRHEILRSVARRAETSSAHAPVPGGRAR